MATIEATMKDDLIQNLETLDARLRWLSAWMIHSANHLRESRDGIKVGGHQASCASMSTIMAALYGTALRPQDKVAVKPHAGPLLHAIHYLLGEQDLEKMQRFRGLGGVQSYPSRTKDTIPVDFSTGSVGLGVAITAFASLVQDYLVAHGQLAEGDTGRMVALMGDAELDEGNIYECLIESYKHDIRNCWWIVDYNRQSLDATTADRMFRRFDDIFETCGWRVVTLKHGRLQRDIFAQPGGLLLREWIDNCPNVDFAALTYQGGGAWRKRLRADLTGAPQTLSLIDTLDDDALAALMTNLGGHCAQTLADAFAAAQDDRPTMFIAYTIKGNGLPFAGHKDNHAGLMNPGQIDTLRKSMRIEPGDEWERWAGLGDNAAARMKAFVEAAPFRRKTAPPASRGSSRAIDQGGAGIEIFRPKSPSAKSCSNWPNPTIRWPKGLSRPRPMLPCRPIWGRGSTSAACSDVTICRMSFARRKYLRRKNGAVTVPGNILNWVLRRTICS